MIKAGFWNYQLLKKREKLISERLVIKGNKTSLDDKNNDKQKVIKEDSEIHI